MHSRDIRVHSNQVFLWKGKEVDFYDVTSITLDHEEIKYITFKKPAPPLGTLVYGWDGDVLLSNIANPDSVVVEESLGSFNDIGCLVCQTNSYMNYEIITSENINLLKELYAQKNSSKSDV